MSYSAAIARRSASFCLLCAFFFAAAFSARSQTTPVTIGQLDLTVGGLSATVTPAQPVIPKNISSGVQIAVTLNGQTLTPSAVAQYLGGPFQIQGEYSGPGLSQTVDVPQSPAINSLVVDLPAVSEAGNYTLSNLRFMVNGNDVFDLSPNSVVVDVIDQVLVKLDRQSVNPVGRERAHARTDRDFPGGPGNVHFDDGTDKHAAIRSKQSDFPGFRA
jgi:hypothetical protein